MILDVMRLREELGNRLIYLMGNHEFPHRYTITLQKGDDLFTPRFEWAMGQHRPKIMALLDSLPFYVRTKSGVSVCHAGAFPEVDERLFDVGETIKSAESLLPKLGSIFT